MAGKLQLVEGSLISCIRDPNNMDNLILPHKFRCQAKIHKGSCIQHALATTLDILQYQKLALNNLPLEKLNVDVAFLIRNHPPPLHTEKILNRIIEEGKGLVRAENQQFPFEVKSYTRYSIERGKGKGEEELNKFFTYFREGMAPGVGLFGCTASNKPIEDEIFVGTETGIADCPGCKRKIPRRHAVCVTGTGLAEYPNGGDRVEIVEYLDSERPGIPLYMTATSLKFIIVPCLTA